MVDSTVVIVRSLTLQENYVFCGVERQYGWILLYTQSLLDGVTDFCLRTLSGAALYAENEWT